MSHTAGLLGATVRGTLKGLPWLSVLAISASVTYAITVAAAGAPSARDAQQPSRPHRPRPTLW
jgi:hypothetical protein